MDFRSLKGSNAKVDFFFVVQTPQKMMALKKVSLVRGVEPEIETNAWKLTMLSKDDICFFR